MVVSDTVWLAIIGAFTPTIAVLLSFISNRRRLREVHKLVDGSHTAALAKIEALQEALTAIIAESREVPPLDDGTVVVVRRRATDPPL